MTLDLDRLVALAAKLAVGDTTPEEDRALAAAIPALVARVRELEHLNKLLRAAQASEAATAWAKVDADLKIKAATQRAEQAEAGIVTNAKEYDIAVTHWREKAKQAEAALAEALSMRETHRHAASQGRAVEGCACSQCDHYRRAEVALQQAEAERDECRLVSGALIDTWQVDEADKVARAALATDAGEGKPVKRHIGSVVCDFCLRPRRDHRPDDKCPGDEFGRTYTPHRRRSAVEPTGEGEK